LVRHRTSILSRAHETYFFTNPQAGAWNKENVESGLQGLSMMLFTNVLGWSAAEVDVFLVNVRKDLRNRGIHAYWPV
jgi:hypothetical protein